MMCEKHGKMIVSDKNMVVYTIGTFQEHNEDWAISPLAAGRELTGIIRSCRLAKKAGNVLLSLSLSHEAYYTN